MPNLVPNRHHLGVEGWIREWMDGWQAEEKEGTERGRVGEKKKTEFTTSAATSVQSLMGKEFRNVDISVGPKSGHSLAPRTGALKTFQD